MTLARTWPKAGRTVADRWMACFEPFTSVGRDADTDLSVALDMGTRSRRAGTVVVGARDVKA